MTTGALTMAVVGAYDPNDKVQAIRLFEEFQDYLIALDPLDRLCRKPGYGDAYLERTLADVSRLVVFATNTPARQFYDRQSYGERDVELIKPL